MLTDAAHAGLLAGIDVPVVRVDEPDWWRGLDTLADARYSTNESDAGARSSTHEKVWFPGLMLADVFCITADDVCYVSMPLFHSNAVMAGYGLALTAGATLALGERFTAGGLLDDVWHFGATYLNDVGKPLAYALATPARPDDADNPLRLAFGNEANEKDVAAFAERFDCYDGFGSTENAVLITRVEGTPPGALGRPLEGIKVLDPVTGVECPRAEFGTHGEVLNLDEAATAERMRDGMYWSGDLGAGRTPPRWSASSCATPTSAGLRCTPSRTQGR